MNTIVKFQKNDQLVNSSNVFILNSYIYIYFTN